MYPDSSFTVSLLTSSAWDRTLGWLVNTGGKSVFEVAGDSTSWGNYINSQYTLTTGAYVISTESVLVTFCEITEESPLVKQVGETYELKTGSSDLFCVNNIYDLAGNVAERVLAYEDGFSIDNYSSRGGSYSMPLNASFVTLDSQTSACWEYVPNGLNGRVGFRAAIFL